ncbi:MAG: transposase [Aeromicrobium sp.]
MFSLIPIEFSSGGRTVHRLSKRGNRNLNHAIHMAAICQLRQPHSDGRAYVDRKAAESKTKKETIRALKRQISNAVYRQLVVDA